MAVAARGMKALQVYLEMIKFEHSVFALPFALTGMVWGSVSMGTGGWPGWRVFLWIVVAMVSCRSAAMAYNRIADRDIDADNPRTQMRAIPAGLLSLRHANLFFFGSCAVFFLSAWMLNPLSSALSPIALGVTLFYSVTKRFTPLCHFVLGLSLGIAPSAAWIATTGQLAPAPLLLTGAVLFWTAGFDIIYSLQDDAFDAEKGLRSLPQTFGRANALAVSRICHFVAVLLLLLAAEAAWVSWPVHVGVLVVASLLVYEQSLVKPDDLSKVNMAFFTLNGIVSLAFFAFVLAGRAVHR
ncbi:MAG: UbiA family prenyltransferase [Armatimonadetes bacterium]|nr:UbiA family prenyltransferase [Armatimonadota bacterium]